MAGSKSTESADTRRPEIELAWRRASLSGLQPSMQVRETKISDVEKRTSLSNAAGPVLDIMVDDLADTRFSILLADRTSRIIDRRVNNPSLGRALDRVLAVPGFQYLEDVSGTNALATAFELRRPLAVTGDEHYLEALRRFCCYGAPIIHPVTHRLEGVIDISGPVEDATALLGPFLQRAAVDIEERLLEGSRSAEKRLLIEFQSRGNQRHPVMALGEGLALTNPAAIDLLKSADHVALRALTADLSNHAVHEYSLVLASGAEVTVRARLVAGTGGGALIEIVEAAVAPTSRRPTPAVPTPGAPSIARCPASLSRTALITGEPGTGRTSTARVLAGDGCVAIDAADSIVDEQQWILECRSALAASVPVIIDNIDALSPRTAGLLASSIRLSRTRVVLTSCPLVDLDGPHRALASLALTRHDLQPLRTYPHKLAAAANSILKELLPDSSLEVAPSALQLLAVHPWPGNLRELRSVLEFAARGRDRGLIAESDLPEAIRTGSQRLRPMTLMQTAERDAIVAALRACDGCRVAAAAKLGIGRTTLYDRLRRYQIAEV
jgi:sigma-54 dependent transcriptional regulator, acetoin dehydrogenase operon transcriptional activator AcoR